MKRNTHYGYITWQISIQLSYGCFEEFNIETDFKSNKRDMDSKFGDISYPMMHLCKVARLPPNEICNRLKKYLEDDYSIYGISKIEVVNGYLNIFLDRYLFLVHKIEESNNKSRYKQRIY